MKSCVLLAMAALLAAPPRLTEGKSDSPVRVILYEDLQCSDCAAFRRMMDDKLLPAYGSKVAFEHRDFPLAKHAWARKAAIAARFFHETSAELDLAWRRHLLANPKAITPENFNERLAAFARSNGIDEKKAITALDEARYAAAVEQDFQDGVARGVSKTPTVIVNGTPFIESFAYEELAKAIDAALAEAK